PHDRGLRRRHPAGTIFGRHAGRRSLPRGVTGGRAGAYPPLPFPALPGYSPAIVNSFWCLMPPEKRENRLARRPRTPAYVKNRRGVGSWKQAKEWLEWRGIEDVECITPDQAGVARGKMMPSKKFTSNTSLALPSAPFMMTISGAYPEDGNGFSHPEDDGDLKPVPDLSTLSEVPWETDPTAQVICDLVHQDGRTVEFAPRNVLKRVIRAYEERGFRA